MFWGIRAREWKIDWVAKHKNFFEKARKIFWKMISYVLLQTDKYKCGTLINWILSQRHLNFKVQRFACWLHYLCKECSQEASILWWLSTSHLINLVSFLNWPLTSWADGLVIHAFVHSKMYMALIWAYFVVICMFT